MKTNIHFFISRRVFHRTTDVSDRSCRRSQNILDSITLFPKIVPFMGCGKILQSRADHRCQYGTYIQHAGYLRLTDTLRILSNTYCFSTGVYTNASHWCVICTLPALLVSSPWSLGQWWEVEIDVLSSPRNSDQLCRTTSLVFIGDRRLYPGTKLSLHFPPSIAKVKKACTSYNVSKTRSYMLVQIYLLTSPCHFPFYLRMIIVLLPSSCHVYYVSIWHASNEELRKFNCQICHPRICARNNFKFTERIFIKLGIDGFY